MEGGCGECLEEGLRRQPVIPVDELVDAKAIEIASARWQVAVRHGFIGPES